MNISGKGWRASPPARQPTGRAKKIASFALLGQPGPTHLKRDKNGTGQNGPGWPVLTPLFTLSRPKSRRDDEPKIKFVKIEFGVTTIVYSGKLRKNQKDKTRSTKNQILGPEVGYAWGRY